MNKVITFLKNFRQTNGYKWVSYTTYIGIISLVAAYLFFKSIGLMTGMGALLGLVVLVVLLGLFNILIIVFFCIGLSQVKSPKGKTNLVHDIGFLICIICYCIYGSLILNVKYITPMTRTPEQKARINFKEDNNRIGMALQIMEKNCNDRMADFTFCFAKYLNQFQKMPVSVNGNVITTRDNRTYIFHINGNCTKTKECYVEIKDSKNLHGKYMQSFIENNPSYLSPWNTTDNVIK